MATDVGSIFPALLHIADDRGFIRVSMRLPGLHEQAKSSPLSHDELVQLPTRRCASGARARNETLRATRYYGRAFWKRWAGYHARSRIEAKMRCLQAFGERIAARDPDRQTAEIHIRIALMNRFSVLGTAEIVRVA